MTVQATTTTPVAATTVAQAPIAPAAAPPAPEPPVSTTEKVLGLFSGLLGFSGKVNSGEHQISNMDKQREAKAYGDSVNPARLAVQYNGYLQAEALNNQCGSLDAEGRRSYTGGTPIA